MRVYLIGSLRQPSVPQVAACLRAAGFDVFDDWYAAGPEADDYWQRYEQARGRNMAEALEGAAANNVFEFDCRNLLASAAAVLVMPAGKSAHLELGWMAGNRIPTFVLFDGEPERWDVMYRFTKGVFFNTDDLCDALRRVEGN